MELAPGPCLSKPLGPSSSPVLHRCGRFPAGPMRLVPVLAVAGASRYGRQCRRRAVVEGDSHCKAVEAWLTSFVIARDFCPWAKPAKKLGGNLTFKGTFS